MLYCLDRKMDNTEALLRQISLTYNDNTPKNWKKARIIETDLARVDGDFSSFRHLLNDFINNNETIDEVRAREKQGQMSNNSYQGNNNNQGG